MSPSLVGLGQGRVWPGGAGALVGSECEDIAGVRDEGTALGMSQISSFPPICQCASTQSVREAEGEAVVKRSRESRGGKYVGRGSRSTTYPNTHRHKATQSAPAGTAPASRSDTSCQSEAHAKAPWYSESTPSALQPHREGKVRKLESGLAPLIGGLC